MTEQRSRTLCRWDELPDLATRGFDLAPELGGQEIFIVRQGDRVYAYRNHCPHTGAPLDWQPDQFLDVEQMFIQCAFHGALFRITDGYCVRGPCAGQSLEAIAVKVDGGRVVLDDGH